MSETLLSLYGITKRFGGIVALENVCFDTFRGEVLGLMGPNGAGKTTLLNIIAGTFPPDRGTIHYKGQDITGRPAYTAPKLGIARTYQIPKPFVSLSVLDNLRVASTFGRPHGNEELRTDFNDILEMAGLLDRKDQLAETLPILSLKKLELARALACEPELILLDEIAAGLTDPEIPRVLETIRTIKQRGITVIIVEHVMKVMMNAVDRIVVLDKGTNLCEGTTDQVINDERVIEAYFGTE
jgi:branched-chain amino acid transport system ATP-binding protein